MTALTSCNQLKKTDLKSLYTVIQGTLIFWTLFNHNSLCPKKISHTGKLLLLANNRKLDYFWLTKQRYLRISNNKSSWDGQERDASETHLVWKLKPFCLSLSLSLAHICGYCSRCLKSFFVFRLVVHNNTRKKEKGQHPWTRMLCLSLFIGK